MHRFNYVRIGIASAMLVAGSAEASITVFTDESAFLAALGSTPSDLETFEGESTGGLGTDATIGNLTFSSPPSNLAINNFTHSHGATNTTSGGSQYLFADSAVPAFHDDLVFGLVGGAPMTAWGATFTDLEVGPVVFLVDGVKLVDQAVTGVNGAVDFFGFVADGETFQSVTLDIPDITYGVDDVRTASCAPKNYGVGCAGSGGFVPQLDVTPCEILAGGQVQLSITEGLGGSTAILVVGLGQAATPLGSGCFLNVAPLLPVQITLPLGGVGPGAGSVVLPGALPVGSAGVSITLQAFVVDAGIPTGFASSDGFQMDIQ